MSRYTSAEDAKAGDIVQDDKSRRGYVITPTADDMVLIAYEPDILAAFQGGAFAVLVTHYAKLELVKCRD